MLVVRWGKGYLLIAFWILCERAVYLAGVAAVVGISESWDSRLLEPILAYYSDEPAGSFDDC